MATVVSFLVVYGAMTYLRLLHRRQRNAVAAPVDGIYCLHHTPVARYTAWVAASGLLATGIWLAGFAAVNGRLFTLSGLLVVLLLAAGPLKLASWVRRWSQRRFELSDAAITRYDGAIATTMRWDDVGFLGRDQRLGHGGWLLRGQSGDSLVIDADLVGEPVLKEHFLRHVPSEYWAWELRLDSDLPRDEAPSRRS
jgi:hypothetical protein